MPNDITVTKNTTVGSERWDVEYTADQASTVTKTLETAGTMLDRDIKVSVTVPAGTEGTPTNQVSPVTNHTVIVSPRVTNSAGYIVGTQRVGNNTTIFASDLVSGTKTITGSGTTDVTNYADASVAAGSAATPATTITANPTISVNSSTGVITATASASQSVTPSVSAGWVSSGTAGTVTVSGSNTSSLTTQAAQTITPTTSDQTIAAGKFLTGAQTIKGDANLVAANIKKDVSIFGVTGTHEGGGGWTLCYNNDFEISTTSTSNVTIASFYVSTEDLHWGTGKFFVGVVLNKAGARYNYHIGNIVPIVAKGNGTRAVCVLYGTGSQNAVQTAASFDGTAYGVWPSFVVEGSQIAVTILARYNSSRTKTIDGTYNVRIYCSDWPNNINPFNYSFS